MKIHSLDHIVVFEAEMLGKAYGSDGGVRYVSADWRLFSPLVPGLSRTFHIATVFTSTDTASDISVYTLIMWTRLSSPFADAASGFSCRAKGIFRRSLFVRRRTGWSHNRTARA